MKANKPEFPPTQEKRHPPPPEKRAPHTKSL